MQGWQKYKKKHENKNQVETVPDLEDKKNKKIKKKKLDVSCFIGKSYFNHKRSQIYLIF